MTKQQIKIVLFLLLAAAVLTGILAICVRFATRQTSDIPTGPSASQPPVASESGAATESSAAMPNASSGATAPETQPSQAPTQPLLVPTIPEAEPTEPPLDPEDTLPI